MCVMRENMRKRRGFEFRLVSFEATTAISFPTRTGRKSYMYMCMIFRSHLLLVLRWAWGSCGSNTKHQGTIRKRERRHENEDLARERGSGWGGGALSEPAGTAFLVQNKIDFSHFPPEAEGHLQGKIRTPGHRPTVGSQEKLLGIGLLKNS